MRAHQGRDAKNIDRSSFLCRRSVPRGTLLLADWQGVHSGAPSAPRRIARSAFAWVTAAGIHREDPGTYAAHGAAVFGFKDDRIEHCRFDTCASAAFLHGDARLDAGRALRRQPGGDESDQGEHDGTGDQDSRIRRRDPERECPEPASKHQRTSSPASTMPRPTTAAA